MQITHKLLSKEIFFLISILIYSLYSSLTPKNIGISEILLVCFLIASLRINYIKLQQFYLNEKFYIFLLIIFLLISLFFTDFKDYKKNSQYVRDYIGLSYIFLPYAFLFFSDINKKNTFLYAIILTLGGLIICYLRVFLQNFLIDGNITYKFIDLKYVYNDSLIPFSLNFLLLYSCLYLNGLKKIIFLIFTFMTYLKAAEFAHYAGSKTIIINLIYILFILLIYLINKLVKNTTILKVKFINFRKNNLNIIFLIIIFIFLGNLYFIEKEIINSFMNSRNKEIDYFIDFINSGNFIELLFGKGLGSTFVIEYNDNLVLNMGFVHNFLMYLILKVGLIGLLLLFIYFNRIFYIHKISILSTLENILLKKNNIVFHSSFIIILGSITFYTSFKHLSFWLIMSVLCLELNSKLKT